MALLLLAACAAVACFTAYAAGPARITGDTMLAVPLFDLRLSLGRTHLSLRARREGAPDLLSAVYDPRRTGLATRALLVAFDGEPGPLRLPEHLIRLQLDGGAVLVADRARRV